MDENFFNLDILSDNTGISGITTIIDFPSFHKTKPGMDKMGDNSYFNQNRDFINEYDNLEQRYENLTQFLWNCDFGIVSN